MNKLFRCCYLTGHHKKYYKFDEWDIADDIHIGMSFDERTYVDLDGNLITGILEGFYCYPDVKFTDKKNQRYVENGRVKNV